MLFNQPLSETIPNLLSEGAIVKRPTAQNPEFAPLSEDTQALLLKAQETIGNQPPEVAGAAPGDAAVIDIPNTYKPVAGITEDVDALIAKYQKENADNDGELVETATGVTTPPNIEGADDGSGEEEVLDFAQVANLMQEKGFISEIPSTVDPGNLTIESFWEVVNHNLELKSVEEYAKGQKAGVNDLAAKMSPATVQIMQFNLDNPNATDEDTYNFVENIVYADSISKLDASNIYDAEVIIRQYLLASGEFSDAEIDSEIDSYRELDKLEAKAQALKPKLELRLKQQKEQRERAAAEVRQRETAIENHFLSRADAILKKGEIKGIPLGDEEKNLIMGVLATNNVPVQVKGGRQVEMGYLDHLTRKHRYTEEGNLEGLMLAILIMEGKDEAIKKHYATPVAKAEAAKFVQAAKNSTFKSAATPKSTSTNKANPELNNIESVFKTLRAMRPR